MAKKAKKATKKPVRKSAARAVRKPAAKKAPAKPVRAKKAPASGLQLQTISPGFTVNDIEKSIAWYRDVLGCALKERWENDGKLTGAEMSAGPATFMLSQDDWQKGRDRVKGAGIRMYCNTAMQIDGIANGVKARGGVLAEEPKDGWGMRWVAIDDPDGFKITIMAKLKGSVR